MGRRSLRGTAVAFLPEDVDNWLDCGSSSLGLTWRSLEVLGKRNIDLLTNRPLRKVGLLERFKIRNQRARSAPLE